MTDDLRAIAADAAALLDRTDAAALQAGSHRDDLLHAGIHMDQAIAALYRAVGVDLIALDARMSELLQ